MALDRLRHEQELGWFSNAFHSVTHAVSSVANTVAHDVTSVVNTVEDDAKKIGGAISSAAKTAISTLGNIVGANKCFIVKKVCSTVCGEGIGSLGLCTADDGLVVATCETVGLGPEDPAADVCAGVLGAAFEGVCTAAINEIGTLTGDACAKAIGCWYWYLLRW